MCGAGRIWEISVPSTQFCCEPKTALKNKVFLKNKVLSLGREKWVLYRYCSWKSAL